MTENITEATTTSNRPASNHPVSPADVLLHVILTLLAPLFLVESGGDIQVARMAALETVNAYRASNHLNLIAVAQIIACNLTALGSLGLSMADDISLSMLLRLRGNAVALNRSAEQSRRVLREPEPAMPGQVETTSTAGQPGDQCHGVAGVAAASKRTPGTPTQFQAEPPAPTRAAIPAAAQPAPAVPHPMPSPVAVVTHAFTTAISAAERPCQAAWGSAAAAAEYAAGLPRLLPVERKMATIRAAALSSAANDLLAGMPPPRLIPGDPILTRPNPV